MVLHPIVLFTKPEMKDGQGKFRQCLPLVGKFPPRVWERYRRENDWNGINVANMSVMQFTMRTMGASAGFQVVAARKAKFDESVFVAHYCHTFDIAKYPAGFNPKDGSGFAMEQLVRPYAQSELWFFLIAGDGTAAEKVRGPTDGSKARDPDSEKFAPYTIRGIYGKDFSTPMMHMTAPTPFGDKTVDSPEQGIIEAIRFFEAGSTDARLVNWPLEKGENGLFRQPHLEMDLSSLKLDWGAALRKYRVTAGTIMGLIQDFPEIGYGDVAAFFGNGARGFFKLAGLAPQEPGRIVIPEKTF
ncbi:MAG: hypothetical protein WCY41_01530 [Candidatus Micrarchaeia archaeon]